MPSRVTIGRRRNWCNSIKKGSIDNKKELRDIISLIESVKTRLNKVTMGMDDDYVDNGSLGLSLCALNLSLYALNEEISTGDNLYEALEFCTALSDLMSDAETHGIEEELVEDKTEKKADSISETTLININNLMKNLHFSIEEAMDLLKVDPLKRQAYAARVQY